MGDNWEVLEKNDGNGKMTTQTMDGQWGFVWVTMRGTWGGMMEMARMETWTMGSTKMTIETWLMGW